MSFKNEQYISLMHYTTNMWIFFPIFVLRSSVLVQMIKKIFGIINKRGVGVLNKHWGSGKKLKN